MPRPLKLPDDFNPETSMIARVVDGRTYHGVVPAVRLAYKLVQNGHPDDIATAEKVLKAVMECQETHETDPHYGNFFWEREDGFVEDLNAVQFVLFNFIPLMIQFADRLSKDISTQLRESIRIGLQEIVSIDVNVAYTNIVIKDITNSCLGGELLGDSSIAKRGYNKLSAWKKLTDDNGIPIEFNSPNYARIAIEVLHMLASLTNDRETSMRALIMRNRLALSTMLHIHQATGRLAGPYSRGYLADVFALTPPEINEVRSWIDEGLIPDWLSGALENRPTQFQIRETANQQLGVDITTYHSDSFALGVSSQELTTQSNRFIAKQSNVCLSQYVIPGQERAGVFFTRYLHNDRWIGDYYSTPSRSSDFLLPEEGRFIGTQDRNRIIGIYAPTELDGWHRCHSAKANLIWLDYASIDEIWVDANRITNLPVTVKQGQTVVVATGDVFFAVRPLTLTDLGRDAIILLTITDGHLILELPNYRGASKTFWELAQPGSFYQGQPQCGFYLEVAEKNAFKDAKTFGEIVASGQLADMVDPRKTHADNVERLWKISYKRDDQAIGLELDLMAWQMKRRWTHVGDPGWQMLESPLIVQNRSGTISLGQAHLQWDSEEPAWLMAFPKQQKWIACYHGEIATYFKLELPQGFIEFDEFACGWIVWDRGIVTIQTAKASANPLIQGATLT